MPRLPLLSKLITIAMLLLAACAEPVPEPIGKMPAAPQRPSLVGLSEGMLLSCAGVPARSRTADRRTYLAYEIQSVRRIGARPITLSEWYDPTFNRYRVKQCEATIILEDGRVVEVIYNTSRGYTQGLRQCDHVFRSCGAQQ